VPAKERRPEIPFRLCELRGDRAPNKKERPNAFTLTATSVPSETDVVRPELFLPRGDDAIQRLRSFFVFDLFHLEHYKLGPFIRVLAASTKGSCLEAFPKGARP
jgi:hypothetical protein